MKKKEDNSFQLLFTALVLVVIAVGGTLAWFAHNTTSSIDQIAANVTAPTDNNSFDGKQIEWIASNYVNYGQGEGLFVPGMKRLFRVEVNSQVGRKLLFITDSVDPALGDEIKIKFFDSDPTANDEWLSSANTPTDNINDVANNYNSFGWSVVHTVPANQYVYVSLYMDTAAGNTYQGETFDFQVGVCDAQDLVLVNNP